MNVIEKLMKRGVLIPSPDQIHIDDVDVENFEAGATILPGVFITGEKTFLGKGSSLGPGGYFSNVRCAREVKLLSGYYDNCVFLNNSEARTGSEIRGGSLFMEKAQAAHTVGCKMTILGIKVTLGSLINYCDVFVSGGTNAPFDFTEIGSGAVHYNFTPSGLKFGSLIGPGAMGEMFGLFPKTFIGGQTQAIAPVIIGPQVLVPAGAPIRKSISKGMLAIQPPLKPCEKEYHPKLLVGVENKFLITAKLITHYQLLYTYFKKFRISFAQQKKDSFLEAMFWEAAKVIELNIQERLNWIFEITEDGVRADMFSKLPDSMALHQSEMGKKDERKKAFHQKQIEEHKALLEAGKTLKCILEKEFYSHDESEFPKIFQKKLDKAPKEYFDFINSFSIKEKEKGITFFEKLYKERLNEVIMEMKKYNEKGNSTGDI